MYIRLLLIIMFGLCISACASGPSVVDGGEKDGHTSDSIISDMSSIDTVLPDVVLSDAITPDITSLDTVISDMAVVDQTIPDAPSIDMALPDTVLHDTSLDSPSHDYTLSDTIAPSVWVKSAGGAGVDNAYAVAVDSTGDVYVAGYYYLQVSFGTTTISSVGAGDVFVAKLNGSTGNPLWVATAGGIDADYIKGIAVDASGNSYVCGYIYSTAVFGSTTLTVAGGSDMMIAKYSPTGQALWARSVGGTSNDYAYGIAVDSTGNPFVAGYFAGSFAFGTTSVSSSGNYDVFAAKLDPSNGNAVWAKAYGGTDLEKAMDITVDTNGSPYIAGYFNGQAIFRLTTLSTAGSYDAFVAKLDSVGGSAVWAVAAGGASSDYAYGVAADSSGNAYVTGRYGGQATFGTTSISPVGSSDVFVAKVEAPSNLASWSWATSIGGATSDYSYDIALDTNNNVFVTGYYSSVGIFGSTAFSSKGNNDIFVAKLRSSTGECVWATSGGGSVFDAAQSIAVDSVGNVIVAGLFGGQATFGTSQLNSAGADDVLVWKLTPP